MSDRVPPDDLRRRALVRLQATRQDLDRIRPEDVRDLMHEINVYHAELEIQNEEMLRAQSELRLARDRYRDLYQHAPVGYLTLDVHRTVRESNLTAATLLGIERTRLEGTRFETLADPGQRDACYLHFLEVVDHREPRSCELRLVRGDQGSFWARLETAPAGRPDPDEELLHVVLTDVSDRKVVEERLLEREAELEEANRWLEERVAERTADLERQQERLRRLTADLSRAEQAERRRLAALLHDNLQQLLVGAKIQLGGAAQSGDAEVVASVAPGVLSLVDEAIEVARDLTRQLRPPVLYESGLVAAVEWLAGEMHRRHGLDAHLELDEEAEPAETEVKALLFECIRELLFNVVKHSGASQAEVVLRRVRPAGDRLRIRVADHGCGFDPDAAEVAGAGFGLLSIRERVGALGGEMRLESIPGDGAFVELEIPVGPPLNRAEAAPEAARQPQASPGTSSRSVRVLIADDHSVVREGIAAMIEGAGLQVVAQAEDGVEAVEQTELHRPDVVLMDVNMPRLNGIDATREIHRRWPEVVLIGLSVHDDDAIAQAVSAAGAKAFLSKTCAPDDLVDAIHRATGTRPPE